MNTMHDYQTKGCSQYGASMGRGSDLPTDVRATLTIRKVPLDEGGYDPGGAYWGTPSDLYLVESTEDNRTRYHRAKSVGDVRAAYPHAVWSSHAEVSDSDIDDMTEGYIGCAVEYAEGNDNGDHELAEECRAACREACAAFAAACLADLVSCLESDAHAIDWSRIGRDFFHTRTRAGMGFWDGRYPEAEGERLTEAAHEAGEVWFYVGDDGQVWS